MPDDSTSSGHSESVENFLKAVYSLQQEQDDQRVSTNTLAEALTISAPSVTDMAQRMVKDGLVDYQKYRGVVLTPAGEEIALRIIRRHRLIELYLTRELGYELPQVHKEAEALEHAVSDHFVEALARKLGNPAVDPHGDPIPTADLIIAHPNQIPLSDLPAGMSGTVARLRADGETMLQHILERGFALGSTIHVIERDPFEGPVIVTVDNVTRVVGYKVAACILVEPSSSP